MNEEEMAERICQLEKELRKMNKKYKLLYEDYIKVCDECTRRKKDEEK